MEQHQSAELHSTSCTRYSIRDRVWVVIVCVLLFVLVSWALIIVGNSSGRGAADDLNYHWPTIQHFAEQLPNPELADYASATTPGYHLVLSWFVKIGIGHTGVQLIASIWTMLLLGVLGWVVAGRFGKAGLWVMLPMLTSMYVLYPGVWLLPDNAGWLGVLVILLLALNPQPSWKTLAISGVVLLGVVWVRQVHIWIAGVIWLSAWLGSSDQTPRLRGLFSSSFERSGRTLIAIGCTIPAVTALVWFVAMWGGLVPPTFQDQHQGPNLATPGFILTQLSILSVFYSPMLWPKLKEAWKHSWAWILFAALVGCVVGVVPHSAYSVESGRFSGWWNIIDRFPAIADRSPIIMLGSIAGAVALVVWLSMSSRRDAWIWVGALVAFVLSQSANHASWQRYHEPMLLMMMAVILAKQECAIRSYRWIFIGSVGLAMMLAALTSASLYGADPVVIEVQQGLAETVEP